MPGVWPSVQMGFITLHSSTAPLGPNAVMRQSHSSLVKKKKLLEETSAADKPEQRSQNCSLGDSQGSQMGFQGVEEKSFFTIFTLSLARSQN